MKLIFWRDGATGGTSGHYVFGHLLNKSITEWAREGVDVVGILIDEENGKLVDVLIRKGGEVNGAGGVDTRETEKLVKEET